jgi:hypothetical protein
MVQLKIAERYPVASISHRGIEVPLSSLTELDRSYFLGNDSLPNSNM